MVSYRGATRLQEYSAALGAAAEDEAGAKPTVGHESHQRGCELAGVVGADEQRVLAVARELRNTAHAGCHCGGAGGHGFQKRDPERLLP